LVEHPDPNIQPIVTGSGVNSSKNIYRKATSDGGLRQGEIISNLTQFLPKLEIPTKPDQILGRYLTHPYAIVVTQDCDLEQDYKARRENAKKHRLLPNILFCELELANELRNSKINNESLPVEKREREVNSAIWKEIAKNKHERYHFFQRITTDCDLQNAGLKELAADFSRFFTIPTDEVYFRIEKNLTQKHCFLLSPYLEHFSLRFHYYHSRVALPEDHASE
jgi:hypothetical protein